MPAHYYSIGEERAAQDITTLAHYIEKGGKQFKVIVAIARGGLTVATMLGYRLGLKIIETVCIISYTNKEQGELRIIKPVSMDPAFLALLGEGGEHVLVVDDLADTGATIELMRKQYPKATFVAPYAKPNGVGMLDYWVNQVPQDTWLSFYWSKDEKDEPVSPAPSVFGDEGPTQEVSFGFPPVKMGSGKQPYVPPEEQMDPLAR